MADGQWVYWVGPKVDFGGEVWRKSIKHTVCGRHLTEWGYGEVLTRFVALRACLKYK